MYITTNFSTECLLFNLSKQKMILFEEKSWIVARVFRHIHCFFERYKPTVHPALPQKDLILVLIVNRESNPIVFHQALKVPGFVSVPECLAEDGFHCLDLTANEQESIW